MTPHLETPMTLRSFLLALVTCASAPLALAASSSPERPAIVVGSPDFRPLPVAVPGFSGEGDVQELSGEVTATVRFDLTLSTVFDVLDPKGYLADPGEGLSPSTIAFRRWSDVGADGLVKAALRSEGGELFGELHIYEVRAGREVFTRTLHGPAGSPRALAHRMSDEIFRFYTREPGVFSTRIAAIRKTNDLYQLITLDVDGHNPEVLLSEKDILLLPSWRPDGKELLLTSYRSGRPEVWAYRLSDHTFRSLGHRGNSMGGEYSPDGRRIAYCLTEGPDTHIWVMNADGTNARRLTRDPTIDVSPAWSPDGTHIVFTSDRAGTPQLYVMGADGSGVRRLTFQGNYNQTPDWSPRGDIIAFTARDERKVFDLFFASADRGVITRITQDQGRTNEEPSFAPNGRLIVFRTDRAGFAQLVVSDVNGNHQMVILGSEDADLVSPAWGPFR